jgi:phage terminase large subunit-like protein
MGLRGRNAKPKKLHKRRDAAAQTRIGNIHIDRLSRPELVMRFLEDLPVTKGHLQGHKMKLLPCQVQFIESVYGNLDDNGRRRIRLAVQSEPRGNGKSGLLAGLSLCHLCGPEAVKRGAVFSAAVDRQQASLLFNEMAAIIHASKKLDSQINIIKYWKKLEVMSGRGEGSSYEALSSDARRGHGLAPSFWVFDELAQVKDRELLDALMSAMGKQPESLGVIISTQAATDDHPLSQLIDDGLAGLDPSTFVQLISAPADADPFDETIWPQCNPALGKFLDIGDFRQQAARARRMPSFLSAFKNQRLNQRCDADPRLISLEDWNACAGTIDREALQGRACWGALDLSSTRDLTALVLVFEPTGPNLPMDVLCWFWLPAGLLEEREESDKVAYRQWRDEGYLDAVHGRAIDRHAIALKLADIAKDYDLKALAFDEWRFADLQKILDDEGIVLPLRKMRQGFKSMNACVDALEVNVLNRTIRHDDNPILTMCMANATVVMDAAANRKLDKSRSRARIDGAVCLAMALGMHATEPEAPEYDFDRPLVLSA